jgi:hypothetical protein
MSSPSRRLIVVVILFALVLAMAPSALAPDADTDGDGLPDAWEAGPGRAYGCDPRHADLLVYTVERTSLTAKVDETIARATAFFDALNVGNPDGRRGIHLHVIRGPKITRPDDYPDLMRTYLPASLDGRAHFLVFSDSPGGQTNGNASISGVEEYGWNSFVHELGHQLGLEHEARGFKIQSPLHTSLMNYSYLDSYNGSEDQVHFSDGRFAKLRMRETNLDETLPFPIASLAFLTKDPYRFQLKAAGANTQVDWNRNGIFGETGVRADINYAPSTWFGDRLNLEAVATAPVGAYLDRDFYVAYGVPEGGSRTIVLRKLLAKNRWGPRIETGLRNVIGDPTFVVQRGMLWVAASTPSGVSVVELRPSGDGARVDTDLTMNFPSRPPRQATLAVLDSRLFLFLREASSNRVFYVPYSGSGRTWGAERDTGLHSRTALGVAWHPIRRQAVLVGTTDANAKFRLIAYFRGLTGGTLDTTGEQDWIGGQNGGNASASRPAVLVDTTRDAGPNGRVYAYYVASVPGLPAFVSMQVADRGFNGGWLERSAYDQWSVTQSAPAAAVNPDGDITYCYRDQSNNMLNCAFHGSGIEDGDMGDFDELTFIRVQGLRQSLSR